jgi:hypothetical protein
MEFWPETGTGALSVTNILIYVSRWDRIGAIRLGLELCAPPHRSCGVEWLSPAYHTSKVG